MKKVLLNQLPKCVMGLYPEGLKSKIQTSVVRMLGDFYTPSQRVNGCGLLGCAFPSTSVV